MSNQRVGFIDMARFYAMALVFYGHFIEEFMLLKNPAGAAQYKFIYSSRDPYLLFDLEADPAERNNLVSGPEYQSLIQQFEAEARQRWNDEALTGDIIRSQKRRLLVRSAHGNGARVRWNHGESPGEKVRWYRGEEGYSEWAFRYLPPQVEAAS